MNDDQADHTDSDESNDSADDQSAATELTPLAKGARTFPDSVRTPLKTLLAEAFSGRGVAQQALTAQGAQVKAASIASAAAQASGWQKDVLAASMSKIEFPAASALALGKRYARVDVGQQRMIGRLMPQPDSASSVLAGIMKSQDKMLAAALKPTLDAHTMWGEKLAAQRRAILSSAALALSTITDIWRAACPPNLRDIDELDMSAVDDIVLNEGIAMYGVPRSEIVIELVEAPDMEHRRAILTERRSEVLEDCRVAAEQCSSEASESYVRYLVAAIDAIDGGHEAAGQALVGSLIEAALTGLFKDKDGERLKPKSDDEKPAVYDELGVRDLLAFAPIWRTYQHYFAWRKDPVPETFSRHATAHSVSDVQFTDCNSVQGLMIACGLLTRVDEVLYELEGDGRHDS